MRAALVGGGARGKEDRLVRRVCGMSGVGEWKGEVRTSGRGVGNSGSGAVWEWKLVLEGERTGLEVSGSTGQGSQRETVKGQQGKEDEGSV